MSIIVAPDSFKGSLTAQEFCSVAKEVLQRRYPQETVHTLPLADGGEGTLDCILDAVGGEKRWFDTVDALGMPITAPIGFLEDGVAVIESAAAIGLPQLKGRENPIVASTYGLGLLIAHAIEAGATQITLTLGGSATNDLGLGMLQALGWRFYDAAGAPIAPQGGNMGKIAHIEPSRVKASFTAMCDVENPLLGAQGAAAVFAPQKGASPAEVAMLEQGAKKVVSLLGFDPDVAGAGAAGGLGYACRYCLRGTLRRGIDEILRLYRFEELLADCRLLISGEGCFDAQSAMGKAVGTVIRRAGNVPAMVFAGMVKPFERALYPNLQGAFSIGEGLPLEQSMKEAKTLLQQRLEQEIV